jgi:hypothetical protein
MQTHVLTHHRVSAVPVSVRWQRRKDRRRHAKHGREAQQAARRRGHD